MYHIQEGCEQCTTLRDRMIKFIGLKSAAQVQVDLKNSPYCPKEINDDRLSKLKELTEMQCGEGNYDYDGYMHGMANGMLLSVAIMEEKTPEFMDAPEKFLSDKKIEIEFSVRKEVNWALIVIGVLTGTFIGFIVAGMLTAHPCSIVDRAYDFTFVSEEAPLINFCKK